MPTKNIFMSHIHADDERLPKFKKLLDKKGYSVRDGSIDSSKPNDANNPDYIKNSILAPRIQWAGTMIVLISPDTHKSDWVDWEIEYANKNDTRIVGVWDHGAKDSDLPDSFKNYGDALVGWDGERIIDAIEGRINNWESPEGEEYPAREIARIRCQ